MKIKRGTTRIVLVFDRFVIKVSIIKLVEALRELYCGHLFLWLSVRKYGLKGYYKKRLIAKREEIKERESYRLKRSKELGLEVIPPKRRGPFNVEQSLFSGITSNWNEYAFYRETKNSFLMPTYFSFFGLINIQKKGEIIDFWGYRELFDYICDNSQNRNQPFCDSHTFTEIGNFCLDQGKLRISDYGDRQVHNFLRLNGDNLFNNFIRPSM